jgi:hypothetical protein
MSINETDLLKLGKVLLTELDLYATTLQHQTKISKYIHYLSQK